MPPNEDVIGMKWVFNTKYNADWTVQKRKARLVATGIESEEMFPSLARRAETVRMFLALSGHLHWPIYQLDVKSGVLNGDMEEVVYTEQAEGTAVAGKEDCVNQLNKALYGLKQAPRGWYAVLDSYLRRNGFQRSDAEPTLFIKKGGNNSVLLVSVYVDDVICMGSSGSVVNKFKTSMMKMFGMEDLGLLNYFLGLEINQGDDGVFVSQIKCAHGLVKRFSMTNKSATTPMDENEKLQEEDGTDKADAEKFSILVSGLKCLTLTRPDIAFSVDVVSRFMHNPTRQHYGAAKRILRYIAGTQHFGIWYSNAADFKLIGFAGSDDERSSSGYVFNLGSGAVSWRSMTTEAGEYMGAAASVCQATALRRLLADMKQEQKEATEIFCDDRLAISTAENAGMRGRAKHIDIQFHFVRGLVADGLISLKSCNTHEQMAGIFTKPLPHDKHVRFRTQLGVCSYGSRERFE